MHLVVLGSGTSIFHPRRASAAFWLATVNGSLLLDCSADAPHRMAAENLDWPNLDAIWVSHLHLDHCAGLAPFLAGLKWAPQAQTRSKALRIFACEGVEKLLRSIDDAHHYGLFEQKFPIEFHEFAAGEAGESFEILPGLEACVLSTPHRTESLAIRLIDQTGAKLVYTSDTGFSETVAEFARDADLLLMECSFFRNKPIATHLDLAEAIQLAQIAKPRMLLLTHLYPEWDGLDLESEAKELWRGTTIAAYDGLRLEIGPQSFNA